MTGAPHGSPAAYRDLLERLDRWSGDVRSGHPGVIPCAAGCSSCCHGPFDISVADAELLVEAVRRLPAGVRAAVRRRAARLLQRIDELLPGWTAPHDIAAVGEEDFDRMASALAAEPCPLLDEAGRCLVYADRPLVCRLIGVGMVTPAGRVIENACPIQQQFPAYSALPPQPFALEPFEEVEHEALAAAAGRLLGDPDRSGYETTIAAAVTDFVRE